MRRGLGDRYVGRVLCRRHQALQRRRRGGPCERGHRGRGAAGRVHRQRGARQRLDRGHLQRRGQLDRQVRRGGRAHPDRRQDRLARLGDGVARRRRRQGHHHADRPGRGVVWRRLQRAGHEGRAVGHHCRRLGDGDGAQARGPVARDAAVQVGHGGLIEHGRRQPHRGAHPAAQGPHRRPLHLLARGRSQPAVHQRRGVGPDAGVPQGQAAGHAVAPPGGGRGVRLRPGAGALWAGQGQARVRPDGAARRRRRGHHLVWQQVRPAAAVRPAGDAQPHVRRPVVRRRADGVPPHVLAARRRPADPVGRPAAGVPPKVPVLGPAVQRVVPHQREAHHVGHRVAGRV
mmetsp:Transcript_308/g.827  ORF Transcript_308/g.827 Transcript_308/m.827 type:complete len:344 (-) Transcript_308:284-1315(-)